MINNPDWAKTFIQYLEAEMTKNSLVNDYIIKLRDKVQIVPEEIRDLNDHNHPIAWTIHGTSGTTAFAIGQLKQIELTDDGTEAYWMPANLSFALSFFGAEYTYSQVAIVIVPRVISLNHDLISWLNAWSEERGNIRRLVLYQEDESAAADFQMAREIVRNTLSPWSTLKRVGEELD